MIIYQGFYGTCHSVALETCFNLLHDKSLSLCKKECLSSCLSSYGKDFFLSDHFGKAFKVQTVQTVVTSSVELSTDICFGFRGDKWVPRAAGCEREGGLWPDLRGNEQEQVTESLVVCMSFDCWTRTGNRKTSISPVSWPLNKNR